MTIAQLKARIAYIALSSSLILKTLAITFWERQAPELIGSLYISQLKFGIMATLFQAFL